nr:ASCH domain-containing protein [Rhodovulum sulfidophilum]
MRLGETAFPHVVCSFRVGRLYITARELPGGRSIETVELVQCRFEEVTEAMALAEGEDDSLDAWRKGHGSYFKRNGGFSPDMQIVWERFILIEDLGREDDALGHSSSLTDPAA